MAGPVPKILDANVTTETVRVMSVLDDAQVI